MTEQQHSGKNYHNSTSTMKKWGFRLTRKEVLDLVQRYVRRNHLVTVFKDGRSGEDWFLNFKQRHGLSLKKSQAVDPFLHKQLYYFDLMENIFNGNDLVNKPELIYNLDEISFFWILLNRKLLVKRTPASRTTSGRAKQNITVLISASAAGQKLTPMIIIKAKYKWNEWMEEKEKAFPGTSYVSKKNG